MKLWSIGGVLSTSLILFITALVLWYFYFDHKYRYWTRKGIKSITFWEALKDTVNNFRKQPMHEAISRAYNKYGRFFGIPGPARQLWIAEPDLIKQILVKDFHLFRNRVKLDFGEKFFQKMLSILCDDDWKRVRCIMSPTFSSSKMRKMATLTKECARNLTTFLKTLAEKNEELDIKHHFGSFAVDVIATAAFATKIDSLHDPDNEFLANARKLSNRDASRLKILIATLAPGLFKWMKLKLAPSEPLDYYSRLVRKIVEEREKTGTKGSDFLQLMMDARECPEKNDAKEGESIAKLKEESTTKFRKMTFDEVISQCLLFFFAGHDTTAATLSYLAYRLSLNPDCQEKLAEEVKSTWEKAGDLDFDVVAKMPYLEAVICESLRINSTAPLLVRLSAEDFPLGDSGITVPKDTTVVIPIYAMHLDPEWFPNPEQFDPDRFLPENKHLIKPFTYLPFGDGPRNCIGMRFIMMVMKLCLCYVVKEIKFVATEGTRKPIEYYFGQGIMQAKKIPLKLEKR